MGLLGVHLVQRVPTVCFIHWQLLALQHRPGFDCFGDHCACCCTVVALHLAAVGYCLAEQKRQNLAASRVYVCWCGVAHGVRDDTQHLQMTCVCR